MTEQSALRGLKNQDTDALAWLIDRYTPYVCAILRRILPGAPEADLEEVASDVFFALWTHAQQVRPEAFRGYLGAIARNKAKNRARTQHQTLPLDEDLLLISPATPEGIVAEKERDQLLRQAVLAMGHPDREIFLRHYYYYEPIQAIAQALDMKEATVKTRLRRGREKLKETLLQGGIYEASQDF